MREMAWAPARRGTGTLIDRPRLTARALGGLGRTLISGDLGAAIAAIAPGAPLIGLYGPAPTGAHALRIARDRALLVTPAPLAAADGWRDGWCATGVDDGWAAIDLCRAVTAFCSLTAPTVATTVVSVPLLEIMLRSPVLA